MPSLEYLYDVFVLLVAYSIDTTPFWLIPILGFVFGEVWIKYKRAEFELNLKYVLLEIKVPRDVPKSPLAMELFLNALHQTIGESTWYDRWFLGKVRSYFSLELVSTEGKVRFFIRTKNSLKKFIETQIYSQYPSAEVYEISDYTLEMPYAKEDSDWKLFGTEFILTKPNPYPIKTYVDYNLNQDPKEELKVDPITPMIEFLGSIGRGEQVWYQIIIRSSKGKKDPTSYWSKRNPWQEEGKRLVDEIMAQAKERSGPPPEGMETTADFRFSMLTEGEREVIKAIERNISKLGFDCGIRGLYLAQKEKFNPANIAGLFGVVKQYNSSNLNGFRPSLYTDFDYPWQNYINIPPSHAGVSAPFVSFKGGRIAYLKWKQFDAFRRRSWFFPPYERKPFVLNSEELATIYHFPGRVSETPTFERIESKKSEPPANLPT